MRAGWGLDAAGARWVWSAPPAIGPSAQQQREGPTPALQQLGHLPRMGAKRCAPLPRKQTRALLKTPELNSVGFFFFFLPFSVLHKLSSLAVNDLFPFVARGNCRWCGFQESFPLSWMWSRRWIHFPSDAAGSLLPSRASGRNLCRLHQS